MRWFALALAAALALSLWPLHGALLDWDEVGYVNSGRLGFFANYAERGTLSYADFREFVKAKREKRPPTLPADYEEEKSPIIVRHIHPPLVAYLLSFVAGSTNERVLRSVQLAGAIALALALLFAYSVLSEKRTALGYAIIGLSSLWIGVFLFAEISFHGWTAVFVATSSALTVRYFDDPSRKNLAWLGASIGLSAVALQTGAFVFAPIAVMLLLKKRFKDTLVMTAIVGAVFLILWPGSLLTSAFLRIPAQYAYAIGRGEEYAKVGSKAASVWTALSPMLILLPPSLWILRRDLRRLAPMLAVGAVYTLALTKFAIAPRYLLPGMAAFVPLVALAADRLPQRAAVLAPAALLALISFVPTWSVRPTQEHDEPLRNDLASLRERLKDRRAFMQGGHIYRYYFGDQYDIHTIRVDEHALLLREHGAYRALKPEEIDGAIIAVKKKRERSSKSTLPAELLERCTKTPLEQIELYDCGGATP